MKKKLGIYAGSFLPFTVGHLNILQKAERILGKGNILVAIGCNPAKTSITDNSGRAKELSEKIGCEVIAYTTFLHEIILQKEEEGYDVVLVRGLRNGEDLSYEDNQLKFIREFLPENYYLNTIFLMSDEEYKHISSSAVRQLESFRQGSASQYVI
jgi:pantetheine-phosphate adenylyltransferase